MTRKPAKKKAAKKKPAKQRHEIHDYDNVETGTLIKTSEPIWFEDMGLTLPKKRGKFQ